MIYWMDDTNEIRYTKFNIGDKVLYTGLPSLNGDWGTILAISREPYHAPSPILYSVKFSENGIVVHGLSALTLQYAAAGFSNPPEVIPVPITLWDI